MLTTFKDEKGSKSIMIKYFLVDTLTFYNILIRCPSHNELGAIISTPHLAMKFPSEDGKIITIRVDQMSGMECYIVSLKIAKGKRVAKPKVQSVACTSLNSNLGETELDLRKAKSRVKPTKEVKSFQLDKDPSQCTKLICQMSKEMEESITQVLTNNVYLFA